MRIVLFEDARTAGLSPLTLGRPAFHVSCGSLRLVDAVAQLGLPVSTIARPHLRGILAAADLGQVPSPTTDPAGVLLVNGALVPSQSNVLRLEELAKTAAGLVRDDEGRLLVARLPAEVPPPASTASEAELERFLDHLDLPRLDKTFQVMTYPHDQVRFHLEAIADNLEWRIQHGEFQQQADGVFVAPGARLGQYIVTDTSGGPIVIESGAEIGPYCYLAGPVYVGPDARILEHASIKDAVSLGHTTKTGGEVEASTIEAYTNKQHHGFLGHSYLGSWINLGAGTCNSDLKNTYGLVNVRYGSQKVSTGMQFVGCIMGDYSKTAINTSIFTGKIVGVCSMLYGFVTTNVPSFCNYGRSFGQVTEMPVDVMIATQARMFARRKVTQRDCDVELMRNLFELTKHERQLTGEPLSL